MSGLCTRSDAALEHRRQCPLQIHDAVLDLLSPRTRRSAITLSRGPITRASCTVTFCHVKQMTKVDQPGEFHRRNSNYVVTLTLDR